MNSPLPTDGFNFCQNLNCQNLSFWVTISALEFHHNSSLSLSFVTIWVFELFHSSSFFLLLTVWSFEFGHNLVLVKIWIFEWSRFQFEFSHNFDFLSCYNLNLGFVTIWVFEWSQFEFLSFVTIWVQVFFGKQIVIFLYCKTKYKKGQESLFKTNFGNFCLWKSYFLVK